MADKKTRKKRNPIAKDARDRELDAFVPDGDVDLLAPLTGYPPDFDPLEDGQPLGDTSKPLGPAK